MERLFKLSPNQTTERTEVLAGVTTFLTMAYIIVVQPAVLSGKIFSGRAREISWLTYVLAIVLVAYFVFVRSRMG